jgi:hypothetical protein
MEYLNSYDDTHLNWTLIEYGSHQVDPGESLGQCVAVKREWDRC